MPCTNKLGSYARGIIYKKRATNALRLAMTMNNAIYSILTPCEAHSIAPGPRSRASSHSKILATLRVLTRASSHVAVTESTSAQPHYHSQDASPPFPINPPPIPPPLQINLLDPPPTLIHRPQQLPAPLAPRITQILPQHPKRIAEDHVAEILVFERAVVEGGFHLQRVEVDAVGVVRDG